ncbi:2-keto-4-pentenoate hydratase/2-oxohepta-3-ene-1,7-dioic acid hydratase in catechol pathway [Paraburkholderia sp. BL23I1N1]|uniref:fumarylacetoacetate hydrolase family protein n=1 Tax=Paraburkholderia sp. BL23I1N1 TaxID=1938802 RepID=UPI000E73E3F1|nr:fumarylacetoacetate hydrolase family protein [Paraburkholderia sp. BL23I1N1]RKE38669.1 2-keto-4-pentenoate hydratase/2-oxohepta-3-ene-1,7-dioic acid hydratase in catechol pathway [Paraburkholderia sp. BL23I1N1]
MRLCRFGNNRVGLIRGDHVFDVTKVLERLPSHRYPLPTHDPFIEQLAELWPHMEREARNLDGIPLAEIRTASPVANPSKIVAAPVNYRAHVKEALEDPGIHHNNQIGAIEEVGLFLKATSSLIGASDAIRIRHPQRRTDHEIELGVVIGTIADRVSREHAIGHVAGYCIGLDITVRGPEERSLRKSIDTYTVLGPCLVTADELTDPSALELELYVNGQLRQKANTSDLILDVPALIAFASSFYTLLPGDVLLTGTPAGVGPIKAGDVLRSVIPGIGEMVTRVEGAGPDHGSKQLSETVGTTR